MILLVHSIMLLDLGIAASEIRYALEHAMQVRVLVVAPAGHS